MICIADVHSQHTVVMDKEWKRLDWKFKNELQDAGVCR